VEQQLEQMKKKNGNQKYFKSFLFQRKKGGKNTFKLLYILGENGEKMYMVGKENQ